MTSRTFVKYSLFAFNIFVWFLGLGLISVAIWSKTEKGNLMDFNSMKYDPATIVLIVGAVVFWVGFFGWVGALRENILFLQIFAGSLILLFLAEAACGIVIFIMQDKVIEVVRQQMFKAIVSYRNDSDLRDAVNVAQRAFQCCGVSNFTDWQDNRYFQCCNRGIESCGVPYSCCRLELQENLFCGVGIMKESEVDDICKSGNSDEYVPKDNLKAGYGDGEIIYDVGCLVTMKQWFTNNLYTIGGAAIGVAIVQIGGVWLSQSLINKIRACLYRRGK